jgi:hypothetical protein
MPQRGVGTLTRQDILLPPGSQTSGARALFLYSGEVSCNFTSTDGNTFTDELRILIEEGITEDPQVVGLSTGGNPIPIVLPTSWNSGGGFTVIAINSPKLVTVTDSNPISVTAGPGLYILAEVSVQNGSLLNAQFQPGVCSIEGLATPPGPAPPCKPQRSGTSRSNVRTGGAMTDEVAVAAEGPNHTLASTDIRQPYTASSYRHRLGLRTSPFTHPDRHRKQPPNEPTADPRSPDRSRSSERACLFRGPLTSQPERINDDTRDSG